jgi:hypothetical protein
MDRSCRDHPIPGLKSLKLENGSCVGPSKFVLVLASTVGSRPRRTHDNCFFRSKTYVCVLEWGLLFDERMGLTTTVDCSRLSLLPGEPQILQRENK